MKNCKRYQKDLAAYLYKELSESEYSLLESHIKTCSDCREELDHLQRVLEGADAFQGEVKRAMGAVNWDALPDRIADIVLTKVPSSVIKDRPMRFWSFLLQPKFRPVYAALFIGILIGVMFTIVIFRSPQSSRLAEQDLIVSERVLETMDIEVARRETLDYLDKSQYLLLDFIQAPPEDSTRFWQSDFASSKARSLLSRKKYLNQQLDKYQMAKAKAICDQIEFLFFELTQISDELSMAELERIQNLIQERQLLLKIRLVKKELEKSEV
jgi:hypothetical protein